MQKKTKAESSRAIEYRYRTLVEIIPDIVYRLDTAGIITFINPWIRTLGYNPDDLVGKHFTSILHPEDVDKVSRIVVLEKIKGQVTGDEGAPKLFDERRSGNRLTKGLEVRLIPKDWQPEENGKRLLIGSLISIGEVSATGVYRSAGKGKKAGGKKFVGTVGIIRDITQRKREEEERKRLEQHYLQSQRLEAIGTLAGGIAHDFKNLLTIALGYIEFTIEQCQNNQTITVYLQKAMTALQRSKGLTQQLLNFSKAGVPQKQTIDIARVLRNCVGMAIGESNVSTVFNISDNLWRVSADEGQIVQVIDNIVINARHAMPSSGTLEIAARNRMIKPREYPGLEKGRHVEIAIHDSGIGISEEHLPKIFDPFFSTKQDGSGLGLSTCYFIVKNHKGHIECGSELGKGTTMTIFLPAQGEGGRKTGNVREVEGNGE
ncbi:MAG: PAS domain S-box protein [Chitinispirillaceae bacterium]|nr:PAS domain S-box protein [Chitinispirillaceae bacterium]